MSQFREFQSSKEVNFSICEHKIILKPVYTSYGIQMLLPFQIFIYVDPKFPNPAVAILKTNIKVENSRWNPIWLPTIEMVQCDLLFLFCAYYPVFDYFCVCKDNKDLQTEQ